MINLTKKSLASPVATFMVYSAVILLGFISFFRLPLSLLPDLELPELTVVTEYEGAAPKEIETLVTRPLEGGLASVPGVRDISSVSTEGFSIIRLKFAWGRKMDLAAMEVREKADLIRSSLPQDARRPIVLKYNPSDQPVMTLSLTAVQENPLYLRRLAKKEIIPFLQRVDGIASIEMTGGAEREISVDVDLAAMSSRNMGLQEVMDALESANYGYPAGILNKDGKDYPVRVAGEFKNVEDLEMVVLYSGEKGEPVRLKDLALIRDSYKERTSISRYNGLEDLNLAIRKESLKNTVSVCKEVRERISLIEKKYGNRIHIEILEAQDDHIIQSNRNLIFSAMIGGVIAFLVILFFLGDYRKSVIIIFSIPVSVIFVFIAMYIRHISLNMISIGGLAIGVGMLVDNGIVVLESIDRRLSEGGSVIEGVNEVVMSVFGSTLTTVIVFLPVVFVKGIAGAVFGELAFTISVSLVASLFTSMTLIPLLVEMSLRLKKGKSLFDKGRTVIDSYISWQEHLLRKLIPIRKGVLLGGMVILLIGVSLFFLVRKELLPQTDQGHFVIRLETPVGTPVEMTAKAAKQVEDQLMRNEKHVRKIYSLSGYDEQNVVRNRTERLQMNVAQIHVFVRRGKTEKAMAYLKKRIVLPVDVKMTFVKQQDGIPGLEMESRKNRTLLVKSSEPSLLRSTREKILSVLSSSKDVTDLEDESGVNVKTVRIMPDREAMAALGIDTKLVAETLQAAVRGKKATVFRVLDDEVDVRVRLSSADRDDPLFWEKMLVKTGVNGIPVPLAAFTRIEEVDSEPFIYRENQRQIMRISYNQVGKKENVKNLLKKSGLTNNENVSIEMAGLDPETRNSIKSLMFAFILSIILVYMILASLFESLSKPVIIMASSPLLITGAMIGLLLTGKSINVISGIGFVMLSGIVVNNAIVLFESFGQFRKKGIILQEAVIKGCSVRLRPVLMTTLTTVFGLFPIATGIGNGNELQSSMAIVVIAGLLFSAFLTMIYLPLFYLESENDL